MDRPEGGNQADHRADRADDLSLGHHRVATLLCRDEELHRRFALQFVMPADNGAFHHALASRNDLFDLSCLEAMAGNIDDVIAPPHHAIGAIRAVHPDIAGGLISREGVGIALEPLVIAPQTPKTARRQGVGDAQTASGVGYHGITVLIEHVKSTAGHRITCRADRGRLCAKAEARGEHAPAQLRLPPIVDHGPV